MIEGFELTEEKSDYNEDVIVEPIDINKIEDLGGGQELSSKAYSRIFDTDYYWNLPYVINVAKYKSAVPQRTRLTKDCETRTVDFSCDICKSWNKLHFTIFVFAKDYDEKDEYHYDCFQFDEDDDIIVNGETKKCTVETFIEKVKELTGTIISLDKEHIKEIINDKELAREYLQNEINLLTNFIF